MPALRLKRVNQKFFLDLPAVLPNYMRDPLICRLVVVFQPFQISILEILIKLSSNQLPVTRSLELVMLAVAVCKQEIFRFSILIEKHLNRAECDRHVFEVTQPFSLLPLPPLLFLNDPADIGSRQKNRLFLGIHIAEPVFLVGDHAVLLHRRIKNILALMLQMLDDIFHPHTLAERLDLFLNHIFMVHPLHGRVIIVRRMLRNDMFFLIRIINHIVVRRNVNPAHIVKLRKNRLCNRQISLFFPDIPARNHKTFLIDLADVDFMPFHPAI